MRKLNDFEKLITKELLIKNNFISLLYPFMENMAISIDLKQVRSHIILDQNSYNEKRGEIINDILKVFDNVTVIINLLKYLKENNFIRVVQASQRGEDFVQKHSRIVDGNELGNIFYEIYDEEIVTGIIYYWDKQIIIEQPLLDYLDNGFKTNEEVRHEQNIFLAKVGIGIALTLGVINLIISVVGLINDCKAGSDNCCENKTIECFQEDF